MRWPRRADAPVSDYRRELDIARAEHRLGYTQGGVRYARDTWASHPARLAPTCAPVM